MSDSESEVVRSARRGLSDDDINSQDEVGWTKLSRAAFNGEHEECQRLIQAGADLNIQDNVYGVTALMVAAASEERSETVTVLIQSGADLNIQDKNGWTALILAAGDGHTETVTVLIQAGANLNIRDNNGQTALFWACRENRADIIKQLTDNGADGGLHISIELYHGKEVLETLLNSSGCDVNKVNNETNIVILRF